MTSILKKKNVAPTAVEATRIQRFMQSRERDLEHITVWIEEEQLHIETCERAIWNLEYSLPLGRDAVKMHEDNLSALIDIKSRFSGYGLVTNLSTKDEPHSKSLHNTMKLRAGAPVIRSSEWIDNETEALQQDVRKLWDSVRDLEMELEGWKSSLELSQATLLHLSDSKANIDADLEAARSSFRPFLKIPADVWPVIFRMITDGELDDYLKNTTYSPIRSTALILSQVCHSWRHIMGKEPDLWSDIAVHPTQFLSAPKYELLQNCGAKAGSPTSLLANLSQTLNWYQEVAQTYDYDYGRYNSVINHKNHLGQIITVASPNWTLALSEKTYTLHIMMAEDRNDLITKAAWIPFRAPLALTISSQLPIRHGYIFQLLSHFSTTKSLTISNDSPQVLPTINIAGSLPQLSSLTFKFKALPTSFHLAGFLAGTLEELFIRHETGDFSSQSLSTVELSKLRVVGLTTQGLFLFQFVKMPLLQTLILYGTKDISIAEVGRGTIADDNLERLPHLEFEDWNQINADEQTQGVMPLFKELVLKTPSLRSVKFLRSWVDGEALVATMDTSGNPSDTEYLSKLKQVTLDRTTGITRDQCDLLTSMVKKLTIYV